MFVLFTDTDTDITPVRAKEYGYHLISMPYTVDDKTIKPYENFEIFNSKEFYSMLRNGVIPKTSAINSEEYKAYFIPHLKAGNDILYVHFSKAMSGTFNSLNIAINELKEEFPDRTIYTIDTMGITINSYIMVIELGKMYKNGATIEELLDYGKKQASHFATYFYADDLKFFRRSGRVSNFSGIMGNLIGIKPIIHMSSEGKMVNIGKCRGRITALNKLVDYVKTLKDDIYSYPVIIGHTDNMKLANMLKDLLVNEFGEKLNIEIVDVNPTAGSHCGPDCIGVSFHAVRR